VPEVPPEVQTETFPGLHGNPDIFKDRQNREDIGQLEGTPHAQFGSLGNRQAGDVPPFQINTAFSGFVLTGQHIEKSGFAGTVGADDGFEGERLHAEVHPVHRDMPAKTDGQVPGFDDGGCLSVSHLFNL